MLNNRTQEMLFTEPLHAVVLTISFFVLTFFNPGANLLVVVQTSLASGRCAGVMTGLGVALGDAFYSDPGLFGMATLITQREEILSLIKIVGGAYLSWFAWNSTRHQATPQMPTLQQPLSAPWYVFLCRGLLTDLSNSQTVLFFINISSVTLSADMPTRARLMAWTSIVLSSVMWCIFLSQAFSSSVVRRAYGRIQRVINRVIGAIIGVFAPRLIYGGISHR